MFRFSFHFSGRALLALVLTLLAVVPAAALAQPAKAYAAPSAGADAEARLLEAELIELAEGDVAAALEIYRSLLEEKELEPLLRARTLFAIGRAHRKLGELGAAKSRYLELIKEHPGQAKLVQAAHRYVTEIDAGASQLPEFDWAAQVEQNPEIQAQIFEWGMQLVSKTKDPVAGNAYRKLLALGATAIPVLEPMLERTRGDEHQKNLSLLLIQLGRPEHLPVYVSKFPSPGYGSLPHTVPRALASFTPEVRARGLAVLDQIPASQSSKVATLRIALGDHSQLVDDIVAMSGDLSLLDPLWEDAAKVTQLRAALARLGSEDLPRYLEWLGRLLDESPSVVRSEDLAPLLEPQSFQHKLWGFTERLLELERFGEALTLLTSPNAEWFMVDDNSIDRGQPRRTPLEWSVYPSPVPAATRALVLRRVNKPAFLFRLALAEDAAIPQFVAWAEEFSAGTDPDDRGWKVLRGLSQVLDVPSWVQYVLRDKVRLLNATDQERVQYSAAFQKAMRDLSRHSSDPWVRSFALDLLLRRPGDDTPETTRFWLELTERGAKGELDGATALQVVLRGIADATHVPSDSDCVALLACLQSIDSDALLRHPLTEVSGDYHTLVLAMQRLGLNELSVAQVLMSAARQRWHEEGEVETRLGRLFEVPVIAGARQELIGTLGRSMPLRSAIDLVTPQLEKFSDLQFKIDWVGRSSNNEGVALSIVTQLIADRMTPLDLRRSLLRVLQRRAVDVASSQDWENLILGDDPVAPHVIKVFGEESFLTAFANRAQEAEQGVVRRWAWWASRWTPASVAALRAGLEDPDPSVPPVVRERIFTSESVEIVPLLHELTATGATEDRLRAIDRLTKFAELSSVEVLKSLLDDPLLSVRSRALQSLKRMRGTRMERDRWRGPAKEQGETPKEGF